MNNKLIADRNLFSEYVVERTNRLWEASVVDNLRLRQLRQILAPHRNLTCGGCSLSESTVFYRLPSMWIWRGLSHIRLIAERWLEKEICS